MEAAGARVPRVSQQGQALQKAYLVLEMQSPQFRSRRAVVLWDPQDINVDRNPHCSLEVQGRAAEMAALAVC